MNIEIKKTIKQKKGEIKVSRNKNNMKIEYVGCNSNASTTNSLIETIIPLVEGLFGERKKNVLGSFEEAIGNLNYIFNILSSLYRLKGESCQYGSDLLAKLDENCQSIRYQCHWAINDKYYSYAEMLVLSKIKLQTRSDIEVGIYELGSDNLADKYYNAPTMKLSPKFDTFVKEVNSFNYKKYGHDKTKITKEFNALITTFNNSIKSFESLVAEHGQDLVNWGSHKLTRRGVNDGTVRGWVYDYAEFLKKKGVKPIEKKKDKPDSVQKSRDSENKTQEDFMRIFKSGSKIEAKGMIPELDLENLKVLMTNPIKSVEDKIWDNKEAIVDRFCSLDNGKNFEIVDKFAGDGRYKALPVDYLFKTFENNKKVSHKKLLELIKNTREFFSDKSVDYDSVDDEGYED